MRLEIRIKIYLFILFFGFSCIEPFEYELIDEGGSPLIVVDGLLTNEEKMHSVRLSYTSGLGINNLTTINEATVTIESGDGDVVTLTERQPGNYVTSSAYQGIVGQSYRLRIKTKNGHEYLSAEELLNEAPPIDTLYGKYVQLPSEERAELLNGVQLFIESDWNDYEVSTFRYVWEETYEWRVPYPSEYVYIPKTAEAIQREKTDLQSVEVCFRGDTSTALLLGSTFSLNNAKLKEFPVHFINENDANLSFKTAVNVKQFALSNATYQYYKRLKENNESGGSLFDKQKGNISGNIKSLSDPKELVMGNFDVSGVSAKMAFFEPKTFLSDGLKVNYGPDYCGIDIDSISALALEGYVTDDRNARKIIWTYDFDLQLYFMISENCSDCRILGNIEVPDFWK
ncbi:MAG: hypothetical protein CMB82_11645 [Flammeovirgaceae bacterium]|nr:hypothetical protein [Flammeovirgaceae bacterium]